MANPDLILMHPPSVFRFREQPVFSGPVSDVVPSTPMFEIYPLGFLTISEYLSRHGMTVRIVNIALKMLRHRTFDPAACVKGLKPALAFGIDLHWLPHADGSLALAELTKRLHPHTPIILGGLTATYYHEEIIRDYPFIDFVMMGDTTEDAVRQLMEAIRKDGGYADVPNLAWRDEQGKIVVNEQSYSPRTLDHIAFDYSHLLRMAIRYRDPFGYIPFKYWPAYPVTALLSCRGCRHNCGSCGGSRSAFRRVCNQDGPRFRSPELLARDVAAIAEYTSAPLMVLGDLLQAGRDYADRFLAAVKKTRIRNEVAIEFFQPPDDAFLRAVADALPNFNVEISPESHDRAVRSTFGKNYGNEDLERMIETLLRLRCRRVDLFFMIGLPRQDYASVMKTVDYCGELLSRHNGNGRLLPMISPLAPFIDPGSAIFEHPEKHGYRFFYRTLREHREALLMPSWKYTLNYETAWMTRDDIVRATYDAALRLLDHKESHGAITPIQAAPLRRHILGAGELMGKIVYPGDIDEDLRRDIAALNSRDSLCDKHELDWPIRGWKINLQSLVKLLFARIGRARAGKSPSG